MLLITSLVIILTEAIGEGILKRFKPASFVFDNYVQWVIAIFLFALWFLWAYHFDGYFVPVTKLIIGFVFVRFAIFDVAWNLSRGVKWDFYGTKKLYDRIMFQLGEWGWMLKVIAVIVGIVFLLGYE